MKNFAFKWTVILSVFFVILVFWIWVYRVINNPTPEELFQVCFEEKWLGLKGKEAELQWDECRKEAGFKDKKQAP